jgi:hypothetical protein
MLFFVCLYAAVNGATLAQGQTDGKYNVNFVVTGNMMWTVRAMREIQGKFLFQNFFNKTYQKLTNKYLHVYCVNTA